MKKNSILFDAVFSLVFLGFGIALICVTVMFFKDYKQDKAKCTEKIKALVISYEYAPPVDSEDDADYRPVVEYEYNGKTYTKTLVNYSKTPKEGSYIVIYINPENPNEIFFKDNTGLILAPIGSAIFATVGIFFTIKLIKDLRQNKRIRKEEMYG